MPWTTANSIALELPSMRLREFSRKRAGRPVLVCAPYALHGALITDLAPGHSVVEALQQGGLGRVYVTDWRSAAPEMRYFSIDSYLSDLNVAIDEIGAPVDLVGLCQGGWLALVYAGRFPGKVRRLVLAGTPVDISVPSDLSRMVANLPPQMLDAWIDRAGGTVSGGRMLHPWSPSYSLHDKEVILQLDEAGGTPQASDVLERFNRWNDAPLDLPGAYYREATNWIFRENRIAEGQFVALGRKIDLAEVKAPVFLLAGENDELVPLQQALATARLLGTPSSSLVTASEPCGHLSLFIGRKALSDSWRRIAEWLAKDDVAGPLDKSRLPQVPGSR
ncbi:alpha/beta fold hydrolase [Bradyrhizobium sp.]|uniref:alpha/beta fold hydrolase n=1 Tax=Bradyrhizobium sp. TaxID=376 RepID=UPI00344C41EA